MRNFSMFYCHLFSHKKNLVVLKNTVWVCLFGGISGVLYVGGEI